jgi:hypothetical protein
VTVINHEIPYKDFFILLLLTESTLQISRSSRAKIKDEEKCISDYTHQQTAAIPIQLPNNMESLQACVIMVCLKPFSWGGA